MLVWPLIWIVHIIREFRLSAGDASKAGDTTESTGILVLSRLSAGDVSKAGDTTESTGVLVLSRLSAGDISKAGDNTESTGISLDSLRRKSLDVIENIIVVGQRLLWSAILDDRKVGESFRHGKDSLSWCAEVSGSRRDDWRYGGPAWCQSSLLGDLVVVGIVRDVYLALGLRSGVPEAVTRSQGVLWPSGCPCQGLQPLLVLVGCLAGFSDQQGCT